MISSNRPPLSRSRLASARASRTGLRPGTIRYAPSFRRSVRAAACASPTRGSKGPLSICSGSQSESNPSRSRSSTNCGKASSVRSACPRHVNPNRTFITLPPWYCEDTHGCLAGLPVVCLADKSRAVAGFAGGPGSGDPAAEQRWAQHRAFQSCLTINVPSGHARALSRSVQPRNRFVVLIQHLAAPVGLNAAKVLAGQRHVMQGVEGRHCDLLSPLERRSAPTASQGSRFTLSTQPRCLLSYLKNTTRARSVGHGPPCSSHDGCWPH